MFSKMYNHMCKHYNKYSFVANFLMAVSMAGLGFLGILNSQLATNMLIGWGVLFASLYGVGKLIDQEIDDLDKVGAHCDVNGKCGK